MTNAEMLEELWNEYEKPLRNYIGYRIRDPYTTDELVAVTYARAWVAMCNGNGYHTSGKGWLYQIARSVMYDHWSNWRNQTWFIEIDAESEMGDGDLDAKKGRLPVDETQMDEQVIVRLEVQRAIDRLIESQKTVILHRLEGYEYGEIAEITGNSAGATKQLNRRAFENLRNALRDIA